VILGAGKMAQLEDNLQAIDVKLLESEIAALDQMTAPPVQLSRLVHRSHD
jgi:aryl-alcohol dehydrogenase-like predicted oxidoreductase